MSAFQNNQAIELLQQILGQLQDQGTMHTSFGMAVRSQLVQALEKDNRDEEAITQLWTLVEDSEEHHLEVFIHAHLTLARLHEKYLRPQHCLHSLRKAQQALSEHVLKRAYPRLAIRLASYYRLFSEQRDSADRKSVV